MPKEALAPKLQKARALILERFKWSDVAMRLNQAINQTKQRPIFEDSSLKIGWVSSYNTKCGIATYSEFLIEPMRALEGVTIEIFASDATQEELIDPNKEAGIKRVWRDASERALDRLGDALLQSSLDAVVIQFNFGFFNLSALARLIKRLKASNKILFITLHSVADVNKEDFKASLGEIADTLREVDRILVHSIDDLNRLKAFDLVANVTLFPHGVTKRSADAKAARSKKAELALQDKKVIASYGFLLPHKGIVELIEAFSILYAKDPSLHLLLVNALYPAEISKAYLKLCKERIEQLGLSNSITLISDFLSDADSFSYLDTAELIVMPYRQTQESASGAVRYAIATGKPVVCTPLAIFEDVADVVFFSQDTTVEALASKIAKLLEDPQLLSSKLQRQQQWIEAHAWEVLAVRLKRMLAYFKRFGNG